MGDRGAISTDRSIDNVSTNAATLNRRQLVEEARQKALEGSWEEAITLNQQILDKSPKDAEAFNRIGRAHLALGRLAEARDAYQSALRADPANLIARRNLQRLEALGRRDGQLRDAASIATPPTNVFIEEVGKTWVDELVNPAPAEELAEIFPGERVLLVVEEGRLVVTRQDGRRLGEVEAKTGERVIELMAAGNRYEAYAVGVSGQSVRIILREVYRHPENAGRVSFPRQITSRAYLRERDLLRSRDESDFFLLDEEDDEADDDAAATEAEDEEPVDTDNDTFVEDTVTVAEDDETTI